MGAEVSHEDYVDRVLEIIFDHQAPRVGFYTTILRDTIEKAGQTTATPQAPTARNIRGAAHQAASRDWEDNCGLRYSFRLDGTGEESTSDIAADCLSDRQEEALVQETYGEIRRLCGDSRRVPPLPTRDLLKKVYRIVRHSPQRSALKRLLRQAVRGDKRLLKEAWASVLYLARIPYAAYALVQVAARLGSTALKFRQVPSATARKPRTSDPRSPVEVLASLGHHRLAPGWRGFFQGAKRVDEFTRLSRLRETVHGEVQLILYVEDELTFTRGGLSGEVYPYIGCSKKCCFFCDRFLAGHGAFRARGSHQTLFPMWALPRALPPQSLPVMRRFSGLLRDTLRRILSMPGPLRQGDLLQQSSAALSTVQAVQREELTYSTMPQTLRYVSHRLPALA
jgi:hypothetical protein